jgi:hypothetical protein
LKPWHPGLPSSSFGPRALRPSRRTTSQTSSHFDRTSRDAQSLGEHKAYKELTSRCG